MAFLGHGFLSSFFFLCFWWGWREGEGERGADFLFLWGGSCSKNQAPEYHTKFVQVNPLLVTVSQNS